MSRGRYRTEVDLIIRLDVTVEDAGGPEDAANKARQEVMANDAPWRSWPVLSAQAMASSTYTYKVNEKGLVD